MCDGARVIRSLDNLIVCLRVEEMTAGPRADRFPNQVFIVRAVKIRISVSGTHGGFVASTDKQ